MDSYTVNDAVLWDHFPNWNGAGGKFNSSLPSI